MLVQLALGIAIGYGPRPTRRVALRLSAAEPPPEGEPPFSYAEHSIREQASAAVWNLVVKPAVERRRSEMEAASSAPPLDAAAYDATLARAPILVPEDAPAIAAAVAATAAATPQEVDAVALAVHELSAVAGSEGVPYSASQIVHAFNAWKTAVGRKYSNLDGEALELRAFAGNPSLIAKYLHHVVEVPQDAERTTLLTIPVPVPGEDWRTAYHRAADVRAAAVDAGRRAAAGRAAADDKLRLRQSQIGNEKVEALELVHARHRDELKRATEAVALERVKLAEAMARLAADEEQGRDIADLRRQSASDQVVNKAAIALATAEDALVGELRKFKQNEEAADSAVTAAEAAMTAALLRADEGSSEARAAAQRKLAEAEAEAVTLHAMLERTAELASGQEASLEAKNRELEAELEHANKRASKAKRLARVAVGEL